MNAGVQNGFVTDVVQPLREAGLLGKDNSRRGFLRSALDYARRLTRAESIEGGLKIDPNTGLPVGVTGKITLREPAAEHREKGFVSADRLLQVMDAALAEAGLAVWICLDRLDVAFPENDALEGNALRALFRVYLDTRALARFSLKSSCEATSGSGSPTAGSERPAM